MSSAFNRMFIRLRGLPWSCSSQDVINFLKDVELPDGSNSIKFLFDRVGKSIGICLVEITPTPENLAKSLKHDRKYMGKRYIEIMESDLDEFEHACCSESSKPSKTAVVRLRGLPYNIKKIDIERFFEGIKILEDGIILVEGHDGRISGNAYVEFLNEEEAEKAMGLHRKNIGHRYVEIFRSTHQEMKESTPHRFSYSSSYRNYSRDESLEYQGSRRRHFDRQEPYYSPYDHHDPGYYGSPQIPPLQSIPPATGRHYGGCIHLSNLLHDVTEMKIGNFFLPIAPADVRILFDFRGRMIGEADVFFERHADAVQALDYSYSFLRGHQILASLRSNPPADLNPPYLQPFGPPTDDYGGSTSFEPSHAYSGSSMNHNYPREYQNVPSDPNRMMREPAPSYNSGKSVDPNDLRLYPPSDNSSFPPNFDVGRRF